MSETFNKGAAPAGQSAMVVPAQDEPEAVEVAAYLIRNKQEPAHRGVRLFVDPSCYDTNFETLPLMTVAQHERIVAALTRPAQTEQRPVVPEGLKLVPDYADADEIVTALYRRFKDWSARGFSADDVTWCEVKADVLAMLAAAPQPAQAEQQPVAWQARFTEPGQEWGFCTKEHHALVRANPSEWPGYETRELYAAPIAQTAPQSVPATGIYSGDPLACSGCAKGCFRCMSKPQSAPAGEREAFQAIYGIIKPEDNADAEDLAVYAGEWRAFQNGAAWQRTQSAPVVPSVQISGHLDEVDAPVWDFINAEARKLGPITGSIDNYGLSRPNGAQPNGGVAVLWNGQKIHAIAVVVRDAMNRTQCVRVLAAAPAQPAVQEQGEVQRLREPTPAMVQAACAAFRMDIPPMQAMYEALRAALAASTGQEV